MKNKVSPEVEVQAMKMAKGIQKVGQTKEQTKLISQGIEKGIAEYKKLHSKKLREIDKQRKQKSKLRENQSIEVVESPSAKSSVPVLPWILLALSWIGFTLYFLV